MGNEVPVPVVTLFIFVVPILPLPTVLSTTNTTDMPDTNEAMIES